MQKKIRVLFVDDEAPLRQLVQEHLADAGYVVETADDGDTATGMLRREAYDVVLLDIRMPRMSGMDVLKFIRDEKIRTRIIMLTAVDDLSIAIEAVKHGASEYLTKPYEGEQLLASIRRVIAR